MTILTVFLKWSAFFCYTSTLCLFISILHDIRISNSQNVIFVLIYSFFFHMKHSISEQWLKIISAVQFPFENKQAPLKWCSINCSFFSCSLCCSVSCLSHCNLMCSSADSNSRIIFSWSMTFISCSSVCSCNLRSDSRRPTI